MSYIQEPDYQPASTDFWVSVNEVFTAEGEKGRRQSNNTLTPPYVTARPDVAYRRIQRPGEKLKFVVLATDGRKYSHSLFVTPSIPRRGNRKH